MISGLSSSNIIDLLKVQVDSYSALDKIDVNVYVVTTKAFQREIDLSPSVLPITMLDYLDQFEKIEPP